MNDMIVTPSGGEMPVTMSTREIADLCDKRHDNVMRDTRQMLVELHGEGNLLKFEGVYRGGNGEDRPCFNLPKRETMILVSGYKLELRARIIDRLAELEEQIRNPFAALIPQDYPSALRALADKTEEADRLVAKIEHDAPKVAFAEQVEVAPDAISMGQAAKISGTGRTRLSSLLKRKGWLTRHGEPYQDKINAGLLDVKLSAWEHPRDGLKNRVTPLITGKGLKRIVQMVRDEGLAT